MGYSLLHLFSIISPGAGHNSLTSGDILMIVSRDAKNSVSQYVRTTLTYGVLELSPLLILRMQIYQQCMQHALFFSLFLDSLLKITY